MAVYKKNLPIYNGKKAQNNSDFGIKLTLDTSISSEQKWKAKLAELNIKIKNEQKGFQKNENQNQQKLPPIWKNEKNSENGAEIESEENEDETELKDGECKVTENFFRKLEKQIDEEEDKEKLTNKLFCKTGHRILNILKATEVDQNVLAEEAKNGGENEHPDSVDVEGEIKEKVDPKILRPMFDPSKQANFFSEQKRCLKEKCLYEDPMFPANSESIFFSLVDNLEDICKEVWPKVQWKGPGEILKHNSAVTEENANSIPKFISNGFQRSDVVQGLLNNCWMVASIANLTQHTFLFYRVVSPDQDFGTDYAGIFHFKLWRYGEWVDVVIDDRLPCYENNDGKFVLVFMKSGDPTEFWSALLEKAFAKVYGSYEALQFGHNAEALEDLTGGIVECFELKRAPRTLGKKVQRGLELGNIYGCASSGMEQDKMTALGLVTSHAYSVTMVREIRHHGVAIPLWRLRNPHGQFEWNQAWSDESAEWKQLPANELKQLEHECKDDGEFWIAYKDLINHFDAIYICNIDAAVLEQVTKMAGLNNFATNSLLPKRTWQTQCAHGKWRNYRAECGKNYDDEEILYHATPKYLLTVENSSQINDGQYKTRLSSHPVIIALMQKYRREQKQLGAEQLIIGMKIYKLPFGLPKGGLKSNFFAGEKNLVARIDYTVWREAVISLNLVAGKYLILPYTFLSMQEGEYLLRCFSTASIKNELVLERE